MQITIGEIAHQVNGQIQGNASLVITAFEPAGRATQGSITFAENDEFIAQAEASRASAILLSLDSKIQSEKTLIRVKTPRVAYAQLLNIFFQDPVPEPGIHPMTVIEPGAQIDPTASIGAFCRIDKTAIIKAHVIIGDCCQIGPNTTIGENTRLFHRVTIYKNTQIGKRVRIHSGAVIAGDGFGYVLNQGQHLKIPQIGGVIIGDDVEIGANTTIDRGAMDNTQIGSGTKIDNLVMIAHNVQIGPNSIIIAQVGIAGSTQVGAYSVLAGQVGVAGHLKLGNQITVGAKAGVMTDIPDGQTYLGAPAMPHQDAKKIMISWTQLPDALKRLRALERKVNSTEK